MSSVSSSSSSTKPASDVATSVKQAVPTAEPSNTATNNTSDHSHNDTVCPHCNVSVTKDVDSSGTFRASLQKFFPGAQAMPEFVFQTKQTLVTKGFYPHVNTLACVGLCRDEITSPFEETVEAFWGQAFICGSLAGMLLCGKTGFAAAHHHAPSDGYFVYYCFTHIAIDHEGNIGSVYRTRSGMNEKSTACGALAAFTAEIAANKLNLDLDEDDIEMSMLKKHIINKSGLSTDSKNPPDLVKVTLAAYETITIDLEKYVKSDADKYKDRQYALFSGVQIHGPEGTDYCWLGKASLLIKEVLSPLVLTNSTTPASSTGSSSNSH